MTKILFTKVCNIGKINFSVIERNDSVHDILIKIIYIFFTRFRTFKFYNARYIISRFYLIKLTKNLGIYDNFNFCFSHSGKYSAILFSSDLEHFGIDIEYTGRRLSKSLNMKIRTLYPNLKISELLVSMILETLVKLSVFKPSLKLSECIDRASPVKIRSMNNGIFKVNVKDKIVFSKIYTVQDLHVCVTLESNIF